MYSKNYFPTTWTVLKILACVPFYPLTERERQHKQSEAQVSVHKQSNLKTMLFPVIKVSQSSAPAVFCTAINWSDEPYYLYNGSHNWISKIIKFW
jgi:hypothetical protein